MNRLIFSVIVSLIGGSLAAEDAMLRMLRSDWAAQERRLGREPASLDAIQAALDRTEKLLGQSNDRIAAFREKSKAYSSLSESEKTAFYESVRLYARETALSHPEVPKTPLLFLKQRRFVCQMMHEYIGYYYDYGGITGGGIYILEEPGKSLKVRCLTENLLPQGVFSSPALSYDGTTVYFAFCEVQDRKRPHGTITHWRHLPDAKDVPQEFNWKSPNRPGFHLYAINVDGTQLRQLTEGPYDDFDPCPLPDGRIVFMSSRRGGYVRCNNPFEPLPTYTLHQIDADAQNLRTLSWHETPEWNPSVLNDGRIVYTRWDYVDRSAAHFHGLWASNPDGTAPVVLFGNYTMNLSAAYQPRAIPNSNKIAFIAGAHHAVIGGSLVLFDPTKAQYDPVTGEDSFDSLERLTPEVCFPETSEGWPDSYFSSPCPLSENRFFLAFSFHPLPAFGTGYLDDSKSGLYYYDRFGNLELLYRDPDISSVAPIPLQSRRMPPVLASALDPQLAEKNEGEFLLTDVKWSLFPLPENRPVKTLRVYEVLLKVSSHVADVPRLGYAYAEGARKYLGEVPVEEDGSAFFRAPAEVPLYFQAVDAEGKAVQSMRSITYLQPGERRGCVGCHEPISAAPTHSVMTKTAMLREPSQIISGPSGSNPMSYPKLIQPVLDRHCAECHSSWTGDPEGNFSVSYNRLAPHVRFYEWGEKSISQITTRPGECGADMSPLSSIIHDADHKDVFKKISEEDKRRIYLWLDANAPFYGAN